LAGYTLKVTETRVFRGPNLYSLHHPVIRYTLDLEELEEYPSNRLGDFMDRLIEAIPTLWNHRCSEGDLLWKGILDPFL
jgi:cyanophycin synthetase